MLFKSRFLHGNALLSQRLASLWRGKILSFKQEKEKGGNRPSLFA
jgi:hypothetical protein